MNATRALALLAALVVALTLGLGPAAAPLAAEQETAVELMRKVRALLRSDTNVTVYRMEIVRPEWRREFRLESWGSRRATISRPCGGSTG